MRLLCLPLLAFALCGCGGNQNIIEAAKRGNLARVQQIVDGDPSQIYLTDNNKNSGLTEISDTCWACLDINRLNTELNA